MFGIEKKAVKSGESSIKEILSASELINKFFSNIGSISEKVGKDFNQKTKFVKYHLEEIANRIKN